MKRVIVSVVSVWVALALLVALAGCGSNNSSTPTNTVTVTISPTSATVITNATQQFTATVTNSTNTAVTWLVNGVSGGNQTVGFISSSGLYTAPNAVPTPANVTVSATSQANTSVSATATVTITSSSTPTANMVVSPSTVTLSAGEQRTFSATVNGNPIAVNWTLNCSSTAAGACGTISTAGVFTAPLSPPPSATVSITATAQDNSVAPSNAVATVQFSNATLTGQYAFTLSGQNGGVSYLAGGSIKFDGNGNISGGTEDIFNLSLTTVTLTGSYHIGADGRGNATLAPSSGPAVSLQLAAVNHSRVSVIRSDSAVPGASGTLELQDASQFTLAGFKGSYAFNLSGANSSSRPGSMAAAGALTADGLGGITQVTLDINNAGVPFAAAAVNGSYTAADTATGRGTLTLNNTGFFAQPIQTFAYYIVDATHVKLIETDFQAQLTGDLFKQATGPFSNASFKGGFAFAFLGANSTSRLGEGGIITLDGTGRITTGTVDINTNGNAQNGLTVSGTYSVAAADAATGRATATVNVTGGASLQFAIYPQANGALSMVEIDSSTGNVAAGRALAQSAANFSNGSLQGHYAWNLSGTDLVTHPGEEDIGGQVVPNGGTALAGLVDINDGGTITTSGTLTGTYNVAASGRGSATVSATLAGATALPRSIFNFYMVDSSNILFLESDGNAVLAGTMQKQF